MNQKLQFNHTRLGAQTHTKKILQKIETIINSGNYIYGAENKRLEKNVLSILKKGYGTTTASGHDALTLALFSLNLESFDEVICPVNAYPTAFAVSLSPGRPVLVDCDKNAQIDILDLERKITKKTKVIVVVHMYGLVGRLSDILYLARKRNIVVIEDCAQAFGTFYKRKHVGTFGDMSCFSFYPTKNLGTLGDGGFIWSREKKFKQLFEKAKSYGESKKYKSSFVSFHSRMPEIQAGILNIYLDSFGRSVKKRQQLFKYYLKKIKEERLEKFILPLQSVEKSKAAIHLFVAKVAKRQALRKFLGRTGIETAIHYPYPIHLVPAFSYLGYKKGDFPIAESLASQIVSLPFHHFLTEKDVDLIIKSIKKFYHG